MSEPIPRFDPRAPLRIWVVVRQAFAVYRRRFWRVALTAMIVFVPIMLLESLLSPLLEHPEEHHIELPLWLTVTVLATLVIELAAVSFAGILDEVVGADLRNEPLPGFLDILRDLPWLRLLLADVIFVVIVLGSSMFVVVPGLVAITLFGLVGPIINIERKGVVHSFSRSARLVWGALGIAAALILGPTLVEFAVEDAFATFEHNASWLAFFAVSALLSVTVSAGIGLVEVTLAHLLIGRDRARLQDEITVPEHVTD